MCGGVKPIDELEGANFDFSVIIAFKNYKKAKTIIETDKFGKSIYYIDDIYDFFKLDYDYFLHNYFKFEQTYNWLSDELSKKVFVAFINTRITGNPEEIFQLRSREDYPYDYELFNLSRQEIFVDCGAHDGDTIKSFLNYTNNLYDKIYAFEPDSYNCEKIKLMNDIEKIVCIEKGVWEKRDILCFWRGGTANSSLSSSFCFQKESSVDEYLEKNGEIINVEVTSIDNVLGGKKATFIKMDIEGSELMALKGASDTIRNYKPKLAICVYHRMDDLIKIPQYINNLFEKKEVYSFYLRHHSVSLGETVLYAIPKN